MLPISLPFFETLQFYQTHTDGSQLKYDVEPCFSDNHTSDNAYFDNNHTSTRSRAQLIRRPRVVILMLVVILLQIHEDQKHVNDIVPGRPDTPPSPPDCDVNEQLDTNQLHQSPPEPSHEGRSRAGSRGARWADR